ncbi:U3 small nucleolar ribonucleoprotein protein MPP10 [Cylas formicarius]|uniref:U3 small nucleolar ribonucleoprotein protein MPP10 n=1 Tax=Cylas formicarius TaxID=197179 RepID=UPI002958D5E2|nr:U3 small nucleolar ribonucleoprotein protein MPP10 [Cylas formicarius]
MKPHEYCDYAIKSFNEITAKPTNYLSSDEGLMNQLTEDLKALYDFSDTHAKYIKSNALPRIIVKNLDLEQIWQQLELKNAKLLTKSVIDVPMLVASKNQLSFKDIQQQHCEYEAESSNEDSIEENIGDSESVTEESSRDEFTSEEFNNDDVNVYIPQDHIKKGSIVDDEFFKLSEMENFLNIEENKISVQNENDSESDEDEDSVDMFKQQNADSEDEVNAKTAKFKDYFVQKDEKNTKKRKILLTESEEEGDSNKNVKSNLELRQERLNQKIEEIEEQKVSEKPWQLKGEITADSRPQNSLLEEFVEFDMTSKPAPVITEQTSLQLEDIIRKRIKDKVFDSVERKIKPIETPLEFKKKLVLDQEKSKQSLAQIYEKEYLEQQVALDPHQSEKEEEPELHKEVKQLMKILFGKLDALSNFYFTSKPAVPELHVVSNLPAITMEEVAPVTMSNAALLAPEEIRKKSQGESLGKSERTTTDKNRERRKKKLKQKKHVKAKTDKEKSKKLTGIPKKYGIKGK